MRSMVRKEILRTTETKVNTFSPTRTSLYHNVWGGQRLLSIVQGDGKDQMIGDEIFLQSVHLRIHVNTKPDRPQVMIRAMLVRVPSDKHTAAAASLFEGSTNAMLSGPNLAEMTIVAEKTIKLRGTSQWVVPSGAATVGKDLADVITFSHNFGNKRTKYDSNYPKFGQMRLLIAAYDAHGTLTSDNIADYECNVRTFFKDP